MIRLILKILNGVFIVGLYFWSAGTVKWLFGWIFLGLIIIGQLLTAAYIKTKNPDLIKYRSVIGKGTKTWDKVWLTSFALLYLGMLGLAGLDTMRFQWTLAPVWIWFIGLELYMVFLVLTTWAMSVNTHFEKTVRIQTDRDHQVIDTGPYGVVRHPGYVGIILGYVITPPALLRSWWAFVPALAIVLSFIIRTYLEDRTLKKELPGYEEYAKRVKYRLIPKVW